MLPRPAQFTVELRRLQLDLIYCYKIIFGFVDVDFSDFF